VKLIAPLMRLNWRLTPVSPGETGFRTILIGNAFEIIRAFRLWQSGSRAPRRGLTVSLAFGSLRKFLRRSSELMVLTNSAAGWRIRAIHWSSHANKSEQKKYLHLPNARISLVMVRPRFADQET
jgi:hypothetical protein